VTAFNGYPFSVLLAVLIHGLILGSVFLMQRADSEVLNVVRPPAVKALLVAENPQARNERVQQQVQQQRADEQRREEARQEAARQEQARQQQARQEEARRQEEQREVAQRQQQERERLDRERQERERQDRETQERLARERAEEQRRNEEALRQQQVARQQEEARQAAAAQELAETEAEQVMAYTAVIHDLVQLNWSRPPSARNNMTAVLRIRLVPTGDVVDVEIVRSSGDAAFDRAAENAVRAVGRFRELSSMPPRMFEQNFRSLLLTFRPEDLLN
tara:strand:+ start:44160 stop:44987 length:828 start_codon:yes stop_codon:yes gene_type:complete